MAEIVRPDFRRRETPRRRAHAPRHRQFDTPIPVTLILCVSLAIALYAMAPKGMLGLRSDAPFSVLDSPQIHVVDGDTVRSGGRVFRLVGFNTPETGDNAQCAEERALGARATARLWSRWDGPNSSADLAPAAPERKGPRPAIMAGCARSSSLKGETPDRS